MAFQGSMVGFFSRNYLLDQFIRNSSGGQRDLNAFTRALWQSVAQNSGPRQMSDDEITVVFANVVGG
jgi:predicted metalloprotease with PDZ domain